MKKILIIILLLLIPQITQAAIAYDTFSNNGSTGTTITVSHTCTGSNLILFVNAYEATSNTITGIKYNGVSLTQVQTTITDGGAYHSLWYLQGPASGTHNIVASFSDSANAKYLRSASYTGASQTGGLNVSTTANTIGTSLTTTVTTTVDNCWCFLGGHSSAGQTFSSTNSTKRTDDTYDSNTPVSTGSFSMTYTASSGNMVSIMACFAPYIVPVSLPKPSVIIQE